MQQALLGRPVSWDADVAGHFTNTLGHLDRPSSARSPSTQISPPASLFEVPGKATATANMVRARTP